MTCSDQLARATALLRSAVPAHGPGVLFTNVFLRTQKIFRTQVLRFYVRAIHYRFANISYVPAAHDDRIVGVVDECKGQSL